MIKKFLAVLLVFVMIFTMFSVAMPVLASENPFARSKIVNNLKTKEVMASKIVKEATELREEYVKHFLCEDGTYIAATYAEPVHYKQDGQWKEIDNSLELKNNVKSSTGKAVYAPKSGTVNIKIPQSFSNGQKVSVSNKGYTISFGANHDKTIYKNQPTAVVKNVNNLSSSQITNKPVIAQKSVANTASISNKSEIATFNDSVMAVENKSGAVVYEDVFGNADLEYIVTTNSIKENVVVTEKQDKYTYSFDMDFGELIPIVNNDNSIRIVNPKNTEETVFYIEAPYMYDANEVESTDIDMSLVEKDGIYVLTLDANSEWINSSERTFPVIIDPTVYLSFDDVFVMNGLGNKNETKINKELRVGRNLLNLTRTYIKPTFPTNIPAGSHISNASLVLMKKNYFKALGADDISVIAYDCYDVATWNPTNITWNNQPYDNSNNGYNNGQAELDGLSIDSDTLSYSFNITDAAVRWLNGGVNNGIMLASSNESSKTQIDFYSSRVAESKNRPEIAIQYSTPNVDISTWEVESSTNEKTFTITTGKNWTAYTDSDWISLDSTSGAPDDKGSSTNKITITENTSVENRTGTVTVKVGNTIIGTIAVTQLGTAPSLVLSRDSFVLKNNASTHVVNVASNVNWECTTGQNDWITIKRTPTTNGNDTLEITILENKTFEARTGEITINTDELESQTIRIEQLDEISSYFCETDLDNTAVTHFKGSSEYNQALATWAMYLSNAAYNPLPKDALPLIPELFIEDETTIESVITDSKFSNMMQYHYDDAQMNTAAHTIAHKKIVDTDGSHKSLITVTIRGTAAAIEWLTDATSLLQDQQLGFLGARNDVIANLNQYLQDNENNFEDERIILVTGHSLGAAVANLVADSLNSNEEWGSDKIYAYTFATPNVGNHITTDYTNIFNILNRSDYITLVPCSLKPAAFAGDDAWGRHGIDIPLSMTRGDCVAKNHKMATYYERMASLDPALNYIGIKALSNNDVRMGLLPTLFSMKCPVGVTVYNSDGEIMAFESQQAVAAYSQNNYADTSDVVSWISDEGEKIFFVPYGSDASTTSIKAYDYGTMSFSIASIDAPNNQANEIKTFQSVSLYPGKEFSVDLSESVSIENTKLYIVENSNLVEITDLNPPLKSVTLNNTSVTSCTPTIITIKTDNTVSEIKLINRADNSFVTYSENNVTNITTEENTGNLIWTIQNTFAEGYWEYDVAVKSDGIWYITERVFDITVT